MPLFSTQFKLTKLLQAWSFLLIKSISLFKIPVIIIPVIPATTARTVITLATNTTSVITLAATTAAVISTAGIAIPGSKVLSVTTGTATSVIIPVRTVICSVFYKRAVVKFQLSFGNGL